MRRCSETPQMTPTKGLYQNYSSPRVGVGGEQLSQYNSPKPAFPLNIQYEESETEDHVTAVTTTSTPSFRPARQLSTFEEESETESIPDVSSRPISVSPHSPRPHTGSPLRSPRTRRILNARSSPNIFNPPTSKSDVSEEEDEEDDDCIVELMTTSGRFPNGSTFPKVSTFPRISPSNSPLLTSRRSPTHTWTCSSDEELSNIFESTRKHRSKRLPYRKSKRPPRLSRVDSVSSDDGGGDKQRKLSRRDKLLGMRQYSSLPATPAETGASESLTELLENIRRQRSASTRTDSSLSDGGKSVGSQKDMNELANSLVSRFELSDEEAVCEMETDTGEHKQRTNNNATLRSVFCCIL